MSTMIDSRRHAGHGRRRLTARRRIRRALVTGIATIVSALMLVTGITAPALAAGDAVLSVSMVPVHPLTGDPMTSVGNVGVTDGGGFGYRVSYVCNVVDCADATIQLSGTPLDPNYSHYRPFSFNTWTPPFVGATMSGDDVTGRTISLGDLAAGAAGSFIVSYTWAPRGGLSNESPASASFLPNGFPIVMSATMESETSTGPATETAQPISWVSSIRDPALAVTAAAATDTGINYTVRVDMASNCLTAFPQGYFGGDARFTCARDYEVVYQLPSEAIFVSTTTDGVYDAGTHTVTWAQDPATGHLPAVGWQRGGASNSAAQPRTVVVQFDNAAFSPTNDLDYCNFTEPVTSTVTMNMTYLGQNISDVSNTRSLARTLTTNVSCYDPFAKGIFNGKSSSFDGTTRLLGSTVSPVVVQPDTDPNLHHWDVSVGNQANVPGVATISEPDLAVEGTRPTSIQALNSVNGPVATGYTVQWELNNGDTGTTTGAAVAPAGNWFVAATVTSAPLAAANLLDTGTAQTTFVARFHYEVAGDAPVGERRANTATASITYPDHPELDTLVLGSRTHSVEFVAPFAGAVATKLSSSSGNISVPTVGTTNQFWDIRVTNTSNVPARAIIDDTDLDNKPGRITSVGHLAGSHDNSTVSTIDYTLSNGTVGSANVPFNAPSGTWITSLHVESLLMTPVNAYTNQNSPYSYYILRLGYVVNPATPTGTWTNTAQVQLTYPGMGVATTDLGDITGIATFRDAPITINAAFVGAPVVDAGGQAAPGRTVTFTAGAVSGGVIDETFTPQYVFFAPLNWVVTPGSAQVPGAPAGATFDYRTVTISGQERSVVVATWPNGTTFGVNGAWPDMTVQAQPTFAAEAGSSGVASFWAGESSNGWSTAEVTFGSPITDTVDIDGDGNITEGFSQANSAAVSVGSADAISVLKEICRPDDSAADGCDWVSDPSQPIQVPTVAGGILYRITVQNSGNTPLADVVAYDVLPHIGDTGLIAATAATPRGSMFNQVLANVSNVSGNLTLSYSASTNPARPEVNPGASGTVNDWNASFSGKVAIRAAVAGTLAPAATASFTYTAAVGADADADAIACNSVAVDSDRTLPSEPSAVCALTSEADLEARGVNVISAQLERPTVMPFEFENLGGSAEAPATVVINIPAGVTVPALGIAGWNCTAPSVTPVEGPATIECTPEAPLSLGVALPLPLPVIIHDAGVSVTASISGPMYEPDDTNNAHTISVPAPTASVGSGLVVSKTDGRSALVAGQQTSYTISVHNPLDFEALGAVTITDTLPAGLTFVSATGDGTLVGNEVTWTIPTIPAQGTITMTVTTTVDPTAAGDIVNTVSATADDPALPGQTLTGTDDDVNTLDAIAFTKTTDPVSPSARPGQLVTYRFAVENIGTGAVSDVQIVDTLSGLSVITFGIWPGAPGVLLEGESVTASASYTLTQADIDAGVLVNSATAHADSAGGGQLTVADDVTLTFAAAPALTFEKTGVLVDGLSEAGATVLFTFTVVNTGNVSVSGLTITDSMTGLSAIVLAGDDTLDADEQVTGTATYVLTQADVDAGSVTNDATASGTPARGSLAPVDDDATVSIAAAPELTLVKTGVSQNPADPQVGDEVTFTFEVENTGNVTVSGLALTDTMPGLSAISGAVTTLAPGDSFTATATYVLTSDDIDHGSVENVATVTGIPAGGTLAPAVDSVEVMLPAEASLTFTKTGATADPVHPEVGDVVTFTFTAENTGPVTIDAVTIVDDMTGLSSITMVFPGVDGRLATGESAVGTATYTLTQADIDRGNVVNDATATGVPARGDLDPVDAHAEVLLVAVPAITFDKTVSAAPNPRAGDEVTFTFEVENTGNVTLSGITLTDAMPGLGTLTGTEATLAPGESFTATAVYELTQADIDDGTIVNDATLSADPARGILLDVIDEVELQLEALPAITLVKSASALSSPQAGDEVTFTFEVENTGNVTLRDLEVIDLMPGLSLVDLDDAAGDFSPGAVITGTAVYVLTQADLNEGTIANAATATATPVRGDVPQADDAIDVPLEALPALTLVKIGMAADAVRPMAGDEVIFTFTVTNTGNVTVEDIELSDAFPGLSTIDTGTFAGILAPGEFFVATAVYPLTQDDIDAGGIENEATVTGDPVRGVVDPVDAQVEIPLNAVPGLELVKEGILNDSDGGGLANPGESVEYVFTLTNTGNVTLTHVTVDDPKVAVTGTVALLAPGESSTLTSENYTVTGQDALDGVVRNTATAGGQTPTGEVQSSNEALSLLDSNFRPEQPQPGGLVLTGANIGLLLPMGVLLLLFGAGLMLVRRRRQSAEG